MSIRDVRLELLRPREIEEALAENPTLYVPIGSIEWHGYHLPVGLDTLNAHGVCRRAAQESGGLVYPPLHVGTGGSHGPFPWSVMMPNADEIIDILEHAVRRFEELDVRTVVLFTGHFAPEQIAAIEDLARRWNASDSDTRVVARGINMVEGLPMPPDHAGVFETTLLAGLAPETIDLGELPEVDKKSPLVEDWTGTWQDPDHPLWGVYGPDPRGYDPSMADDMITTAARWLAGEAAAEPREG